MLQKNKLLDLKIPEKNVTGLFECLMLNILNTKLSQVISRRQ